VIQFAKTPALRYTIAMSVDETLARIRPALQKRAGNALARGSGVRENFNDELAKFFDLLEQAVVSGDAKWLDPLLYDWATARTQTDLEEGERNVTALLNEIISLSFEAARENLEDSEALDLIGALMPVYLHCIERVTTYENESRVTYISNELQAVQTKLERLDKSKSNFIAVAAHELKTPLTLIEGYASMISDSIPRELDTVHMLVQGVHNGIRRLREIVDDMIDVSLIDNSLMSLNFQPTWINRTLHLLKADAQAIVEERKQTMEVRVFPGSEELIFADPERIYQAIRNILSNAIKYTPDGGTITVDGRTLPGFLEITVTDTGIGISPENQERIFEKFGQVGNISLHSSGKTKFKGGGPGLGLPIAKGIIEAHGGTLWVESEGYDEVACHGSIFHILLPLRTQPNDPKLAKLFGAETPTDQPGDVGQQRRTDDKK
jgi:signal transduction histidine kinase